MFKKKSHYQCNHRVDERNIFVLQGLHVAHDARLRVMRVEHCLRKVGTGALHWRLLDTVRENVRLNRHLFGNAMKSSQNARKAK